MSSKYPGGIISKTAPVPSGPYADSTAPGVWTLEQQAYWQKLGQWPTAGNVNPNLFIENLFSTWLYTGTGAAQTITNGINLSANGGLVWSKSRSAVQDNSLIDTVRGNGSILYSNLANAADTGVTTGVTAFNTTGYALGSGSFINQNAATYASWTFRKQAKFFDVVTYTGTGGNQTISHNLGSVPGCIIVKGVNDVNGWYIYHRGLTTPNNYTIYLSSTSGQVDQGSNVWDVTSTTFQANQSSLDSNKAGTTYIAYIFAHDAGGFGLTGTDNVISCGNATVSGNATSVTLGYEPQWVAMKRISGISDWFIVDNMRGFSSTGSPFLRANTTGAESANTGTQATATGFTSSGVFDNGTYIYIAIRRGPMAVPTVGTSVFSPFIGSDTSTITTGFPVDMLFDNKRAGNSNNTVNASRLVGENALITSSIAAETAGLTSATWFQNNTGYLPNALGTGIVAYAFQRAPGFMDVVCYTGTGSATTVAHNLAAVPELMINKRRSGTLNWYVYVAPLGNDSGLWLNTTTAVRTGDDYWNSTTPTASVFSIGAGNTNLSGSTYVQYLFATVAGVSKVGSYTGTGAAQTINCGFTTGARFVLIKRTDSTGDWYVWDSARGIIPANDPYLLLNSTAAEVTGTDYIDTTSVGFDITSTAPSAINANGGTFIFLAIA